MQPQTATYGDTRIGLPTRGLISTTDPISAISRQAVGFGRTKLAVRKETVHRQETVYRQQCDPETCFSINKQIATANGTLMTAGDAIVGTPLK